ncbi:MAG TPA: hypothetical protein VME70_13515 [Mycobacteriales bacterium]|nr:hypothetical protein [Mycobacteriales bacterium]
MTFDGSGDEPSFSHLDDPTPPGFGPDALTRVVSRGQHLRRRRRIAYSASTFVVIVAIVGTAVGVIRTNGSSNNQTINTAKSPTSTSSLLSPTPRHQKSGKPGGITQTTGGGTRPHHPSGGGGPTTATSPACVTETPSGQPSDPPDTAAAGASTSPAPDPTPTPTCVTPTPTESGSSPPPSPSVSPSVTDSGSGAATP